MEVAMYYSVKEKEVIPSFVKDEEEEEEVKMMKKQL